MSASSTTLSALRDRVEQILLDTGNSIWATGAIDAAVRLALFEYSEVRPYLTKSTLALTSAISTNGREIDISSLSDLVAVVDVWAPYATSDDKRLSRRFVHWPDDEEVDIIDGLALSTLESARVFYSKNHTLNGLDSEVATTFRVGDENIIALGAAGYACLSRAVDLAEQVTIDRETVDKVRELAGAYLDEFRRRLLPQSEGDDASD